MPSQQNDRICIYLAILIAVVSVMFYTKINTHKTVFNGTTNCTITNCECRPAVCQNRSKGYPEYHHCFDCWIQVKPNLSFTNAFKYEYDKYRHQTGDFCKDYIEGTIAPCSELDAKFKN